MSGQRATDFQRTVTRLKRDISLYRESYLFAEWLNAMLSATTDSIKDRMAMLSYRSEDGEFLIEWCNRAFSQKYARALTDGNMFAPPPLTKRSKGFLDQPLPVDLDKLYPTAEEDLTASAICEQLPTDRSELDLFIPVNLPSADPTSAFRHFNNVRITRIDKQYLLLSERDSTLITSLVFALEEWNGASSPTDLYTKIVNAFAQGGVLNAFQSKWCRLWIFNKDEMTFSGVMEFGLPKEKSRDFVEGRVKFNESDEWLFHVRRTRRPAIYQELSLDDSVKREKEDPEFQATGFCRHPHPRGLPYFLVRNWKWHEGLGISQPHAWVDCPLMIGDDCIGCLSCSIPENLNVGLWQSLIVVSQAAATAIHSALLMEEQSNWLASVNHNLDTAVYAAMFCASEMCKAAQGGDFEKALEMEALMKESMAQADRQRRNFVFGLRGIDPKLPCERACLINTVRRAVETLRASWTLTNLETGRLPSVELIIEPGLLELPFTTSHFLVHEIITHLLSNSRESHRPPNRPDCRIVVQVGRRGTEKAYIVVKDNGPGLPDDMKNSPFARRPSRRPSGTGLGLAYCRNAADRCGGVISYGCDERFCDVNLATECSLTPSETGARWNVEIPDLPHRTEV